ncbi:MAG TPA: ECF-type sigma factor [Isosphaeraceae bacterium]|nr:ECF-type sigma factor [Isosphaeraceae bacterium]
MPPDDCGSITRYLLISKESDDRILVDDAVRTLWERYYQKLVRLTRDRLRNSPSGRQHVFAVTTADTLQWLLDALPNETLRTIATNKMEGYTNQEIARSLTCCEATIELKLRHMRAVWLDLIQAESTESDA